MASKITVKALPRQFTYSGVALPDPGAHLSLEQVRDVYSAAYPEITNAAIDGPEERGGHLVYTIRRAAGAKGAY